MALFAAGIVGANVFVVPVAGAAGQVWNGKYFLVSYASGKTGTSLAARQPEPDFSGISTFVTECSPASCVATVVDSPRPKNPTLPLAPRYTWNGSAWVHIYEWQWDCFMSDGVPKVWTPAKSVALYTPQSDRTLRGSWRTDIYGGPCDGTVIWDVAAFPTQ
jgi:hypothetical protein